MTKPQIIVNNSNSIFPLKTIIKHDGTKFAPSSQSTEIIITSHANTLIKHNSSIMNGECGSIYSNEHNDNYYPPVPQQVIEAIYNVNDLAPQPIQVNNYYFNTTSTQVNYNLPNASQFIQSNVQYFSQFDLPNSTNVNYSENHTPTKSKKTESSQSTFNSCKIKLSNFANPTTYTFVEEAYTGKNSSKVNGNPVTAFKNNNHLKNDGYNLSAQSSHTTFSVDQVKAVAEGNQINFLRGKKNPFNEDPSINNFRTHNVIGNVDWNEALESNGPIKFYQALPDSITQLFASAQNIFGDTPNNDFNFLP